jgi:hypothetical protein
VRAVLGQSRNVRHRLMPVRQRFLNESGDSEFDRIALEYNGFAGLADDLNAAAAQFRWLLAHLPDADELVVRNATAATATALRAAAAAAGWRVRRTNLAPAALLDLAPVRAAGGDLIAGLGRNTRFAIRRAIRLYESSGPLQIARAQTIAEAQAWFERLATLHVASWEGGQPATLSPTRISAPSTGP